MDTLLTALGIDDVASVSIGEHRGRTTPRTITAPSDLAAIADELRRLPACGDMMAKLAVSSLHLVTITGPDGRHGELKVYNRGIVQSPADTSVIEGTDRLVALLGLAGSGRPWWRPW